MDEMLLDEMLSDEKTGHRHKNETKKTGFRRTDANVIVGQETVFAGNPHRRG
jgi:hypothetical protein